MIIQWIAIGVLILIGFYLLKVEHHAKRVKIVIILIIGAIIYFSIVGHFSSNSVDITSPRGIINGVYLYFGWIGQTASSLWDIGVDTTHLVGNAIRPNDTDQKKNNT
jgi:hypothetical protein